ncbi:hypothetical protein STRTUCAR8_09182 [Streptomyces turgidiscabies Car8]|uniref:Uncharacterized protein n=1 Tax=Streptomyces turgidiscabies (strain Car8) TaxID=698760 RepID=L7F0F9_STRT8|nr:hypothetical protein STRTUCAR8_09182 [Streptomyces turgidiscabies Car8]
MLRVSKTSRNSSSRSSSRTSSPNRARLSSDRHVRMRE